MSKTVEEILEQIGEVAHEKYLGCSQTLHTESGFEYSYSDEVVNILQDPRVTEAINQLLIEAKIEELKSLPWKNAPQYGINSPYVTKEWYLNRIAELQQSLKDKES